MRLDDLLAYGLCSDCFIDRSDGGGSVFGIVTRRFATEAGT